MKKIVVYDLETYPNFTLGVFKAVGEEAVTIAKSPAEILQMARFFNSGEYRLAGYNSEDFDDQILALIADNPTVSEAAIAAHARALIEKKLERRRPWDLPVRTIDLSFYCKEQGEKKNTSITTEKEAGESDTETSESEAKKKRYWRSFLALKTLGARAGLDVQDLPYEPERILSEAEKDEVTRYCKKDIAITERVYNQVVADELPLREELAALCGGEINEIEFINAGTAAAAEKYLLYHYAAAIKYENWRRLKNELKEAGARGAGADAGIDLAQYLGKIELEFESGELALMWERLRGATAIKRDELETLCKREIDLPAIAVNFGLGGLHAAKRGVYRTDADNVVFDIDASSYYPSMMLQYQIAPSHLQKPAFLCVFQALKNERIRAKKAGEKRKAGALKIVLNSTFGKAGSRYSPFYCPAAMYAVTLLGQMLLLSLLERLHGGAGAAIFMANTDGLTFAVNRTQVEKARSICDEWQQETGIDLETAEIESAIVRDANNYALWQNGKAKKQVGFFGAAYLSGAEALLKKAAEKVVCRAVCEKLLLGRDMENVVRDCKDLSQFWTVAGKVMVGGEFAKTARFYRSTAGVSITNAKNGASVAKCARMVNDLPATFPPDVDYEYYLSKAREELQNFAIDEAAEAAKKLVEKWAARSDKTKACLFKKAARAIMHDDKIYCIFAGKFGDGGKPTAADWNKPQRALPWAYRLPGGVVNYYGESGKPALSQIELSDYSYISLNPISAAGAEHAAANFGGRYAYTVEYDRMPLPVQHERLNGAPATVICWSGNKSLHAHFVLERAATDEENEKIESLLQQVFGDSDQTTWKLSQFVRLPGGCNYSTGATQEIVKVGGRITPEEFEKWLSGQPRRFPPKDRGCGKTEYEPRPETAEKICKMVEAWLSKIGAGRLRKTAGWGNVAIPGWKSRDMACPVNARERGKGNVWHTAGAGGFCVFVGEDGKLRARCQHGHCSGIKTTEFLDAMPELRDALKAAGAVEAIEIEPAGEHVVKSMALALTLPEFQKRITELQPREFLFVRGATGVGKSYNMQQAMIEYARRGESSLLICATGEEACRATGKLKSMLAAAGLPAEWLELVMSGTRKDEVTDEEEDAGADARLMARLAKIAVTTLGYVGRKGHTAAGYKIFHELIEGRIVFFDEIQTLYEKSTVSLPLLARYYLHGAVTCKLAHKCPKMARRGDCSKCFLCGLREDMTTREHERPFYKSFPRPEIDSHSVRDELPFMAWSDALDHSKYKQAYGNLYFRGLDLEPSLDLAIDLDATGQTEYLANLAAHLYNPHLRIIHPIDNQTAERREIGNIVGALGDKHELSKIVFPRQACGIPILCGIDLLPYLQLFGATVRQRTPRGDNVTIFAGAKAIVATSATIPGDLKMIFGEAAGARGWSVADYEISEIPFRFDVTLLKLAGVLSVEKTARLAIALDKNSECKQLIFAARKEEAQDAITILNRAVSDKVVFFRGAEFERGVRVHKGTVNDKIWLTYARSAISRGADFPEISILVIDCQQFLPVAAIGRLKEGMSKAERNKALTEEIWQNATQIVGRVLRSACDRVPGQTVDDPRKIVVLLHGLPAELSDFAVEEKLTHHAAEIRETFCSKEEKKLVASLTESIVDVLSGRAPKDHAELDKQAALAKAAAGGGARVLTPKQRAETEIERKQARAENTYNKKLEQARAMLAAGKPWREISNSLHLLRDKELYERVKKELGQ